MKKRIIHCFNKSTQTYDAAAEIQMRVAKQLAKQASAVSAKSILEIGCGTGLLSQLLLTQFPNAEFLLTDIAPNMIEHCQNRFASYEKINTVCIDGEKITVPETINLLVSSMTLHWFSNVVQGIANMISQLPSGSYFIFSLLGEGSMQEWHDVCQQHNLPIATPSWITVSQLENFFPTMQIKNELIKITHQGCYDFLKTLKNIGATAANEYYRPLSAGQLRRVLRQNKDSFTISYHVIYGCYRKP